MRIFTLALAAFALSPLAPHAQTISPNSVRAHETFLASDALGGRGSASRDEQIAATYVASQFIAYGLKTAPGMNDYLQQAELNTPKLDGHATLTVGDAVLQQGVDFDLLSSPATDASGTVTVTSFASSAKAQASDAVLFTGEPKGNPLRAATAIGPAPIVMMERSAIPPKMLAVLAAETSLPITVKGEQGWRAKKTIIALSPAAAKHLAAMAGKPIQVKVHVVDSPPRFTYNAVGYLPGTDTHAGTLLLTAHLDHLGMQEKGGDRVYNGANDDASGTTAILELAHALASGPAPKRSILFVCYGSEELGGLGSTYFGAHPPVPLDKLVANLEFEMIGAQDPKMPKGVLLLTGWDRSNLGPELKKHGALLGPDPYPEQHFFERSDNYSLALKGVVAHTAAGWGTVPTYHQPNDDLQHLDIPFMTAAIQSLVEPVRWLASSDFVPQWNEGGKPERQ